MRRSHILLLVLVGLIGLLQWDGLPAALDGLMGGLAWSSEIVAFLKANTQGLLLLFLIGVFFEIRDAPTRRPKALVDAEAETESYALLRDTVAEGDGIAFVKLGLRKLYGETASVQMADNLFTSSGVLDDLDLSLSIKETEADFSIEFSLSYQAKTTRFTVAVSTNPAIIEGLLATGEVNEAFYANDASMAIPAEIKRASMDGGTEAKKFDILTFEKASDKAKRKISNLVGASDNTFKSFELYQEIVPRFTKVSPNPYRYIIVYTITQSLACPYTYWMNDRISRIREISVDVSGISEDHRSAVKIHRFMALSRWKAE